MLTVFVNKKCVSITWVSKTTATMFLYTILNLEVICTMSSAVLNMGANGTILPIRGHLVASKVTFDFHNLGKGGMLLANSGKIQGHCQIC